MGDSDKRACKYRRKLDSWT